MKRICLLLCLLLLLTGCARTADDGSVLVFIEEIEGCTIENNGQRVRPGEDAVFTLTFDYGLSLAGTDYPGRTRMDADRRTVTLTLEEVRCPTRVTLSLTHDFARITYQPNGGEGKAVTESYSLLEHARPNTSTGAGLFTREGHTLLCWNTEPDGSGTRIGLGSRLTVENADTVLYAQWAPWEDASSFTWKATAAAVITGCISDSETLVIPAQLGGLPVSGIAEGAFTGCSAAAVILPATLEQVEDGAFTSCAVEELVLFDNIVSISDAAFQNCSRLRTLSINAAEVPFGYTWRKESCYADKVDLLIAAQGKQKLVFYGGCAMWYNLDSALVRKEFGDAYAIVNMGLNGTVNSQVQMQILGHFLEEGDILFHAPELSSRLQMLTAADMLETDKVLWCGIENNYDLFRLVDLRTVGGVFDSLRAYLDRKDAQASYAGIYTDDLDRTYMDDLGGIPFARLTTLEDLGDQVWLDPARIDEASISRLDSYYDWYAGKGVRVYLSYACINLDAVPQDQRENAAAVDAAFRSAAESMDHAVLISRLEDYLYEGTDFYDTNYHLLTEPTRKNTELWLRDLKAQMEADGLWEATP